MMRSGNAAPLAMPTLPIVNTPMMWCYRTFLKIGHSLLPRAVKPLSLTSLNAGMNRWTYW